MRPQGTYHTLYPNSLLSALNRLRQGLQHSDTSNQELHTLIDLVLDEVWTVHWIRTPTCRIPDPTECYVMLTTLRHDGTFKPPKNNVTLLLAKFKYLIRVYMVRRMTDEGTRKKTAKELEHWYWEKEDTTFNTICDLQHYASAIAMLTQELPNVFWME